MTDASSTLLYLSGEDVAAVTPPMSAVVDAVEEGKTVSTVAVAASAAAARHRRGGEGILCIRGLSHCGFRAEVSPSQRIGEFSAAECHDYRRHQTETGRGVSDNMQHQQRRKHRPQ